MKRWHLTPILATLAIASALVVPRLTGLTGQDEEPPPPPPVEVDAVPPEVAQPPGSVSLDVRMDRSAVLAGTSASRYLTLTLTADPDAGVTERQPVDVVVVMDTSGSMAAAGKITYARRAATDALGLLAGSDRFGLVTFDRAALVRFPSQTLWESRGVAADVVSRVGVHGDTNIAAGLEEGARQLAADGVPGGRLILLSDGIATAGITDPGAIARQAERLAQQGVVVSAIGLGLEHDGHLLSRLAMAGGGDYDFVDDPSQLAAVLTEDVSGAVTAVARDLSVDLALPDGVELVAVHGWSVQHGADGHIRVPVGDLAAGQSKRVVAEVRLRAPEALGSTPVASVSASWFDLPDDATRTARIQAEATVTAALADVHTSADATAQAVSAQAVAAGLLARAAEAFTEGEADEAERYAFEGLELLEAAPASAAPIPEVMAAQKDRMRERGALYGSSSTTPTSAAGRRAVLEDVDDAYDWAH